MTKLEKLLFASALAGGAIAIVSVLSVGGLVIARQYYVDHYIIPQNGMYPTKPARSHALARREPYESVDQVQRGDIVVLVQTSEGRTFKLLWRVIGLPGETVQQLPSGELVVEGHAFPLLELRVDGEFRIFRECNSIAEYEVAYRRDRLYSTRPSPVFEVGDDQLFVVGDNRDNSYDSRAYGPVSFSSVVGKVFW